VVPVGSSEKSLVRPAAAVVKVGIVLPREPDPTVDLDVLGGDPSVGAAAIRGSDLSCDWKFVGLTGQA
jgi:hypothetical protein